MHLTMPPTPLPFSPESISTDEQVALLGAPPPSWKDDGQDHHGDDVDEKGFNPVKRLAALARSPCVLALFVLGTILCVTFLFLLRRSVFFNVLYEAVISELVRFFKDGLFAFLIYIQELDTVSGPTLLAAVYALCIVLFIPVTVLNLAAGFCFGITIGFLSVSFGGIAGASISFLLGRTIARDWVGSRVTSAFDSSALDQMLQRNPESAFKIVCLSRLPPCLPFPCVNYSYAMTSVPFWTYFWATWLGLAPGTFAYVYLGSAVRNLADVVSGQHSGGPVYFTVLALGVFGTFAVAIYLMREAQLALGIGKDGAREDIGRGRAQGNDKRSMFSGMRNRSGSNSPREWDHTPTHSRRRSGGAGVPASPGTNGDGPNGSTPKGSSPKGPTPSEGKKKSILEAVLPVDAGRELQRDGEFILFSGGAGGGRKPRGSSKHKRDKGRQRTLTRNSSIWNLFNVDRGKGESSPKSYEAETEQLEYFL